MIDTALKVSQSLYCFTTFICHGVENYFPRLSGMGITDTLLTFSIFNQIVNVGLPYFYM